MLKLEHVSKTFNLGTVNEKKALQDLNLTINDGDFYYNHADGKRGMVKVRSFKYDCWGLSN